VLAPPARSPPHWPAAGSAPSLTAAGIPVSALSQWLSRQRWNGSAPRPNVAGCQRRYRQQQRYAVAARPQPQPQPAGRDQPRDRSASSRGNCNKLGRQAPAAPEAAARWGARQRRRRRRRRRRFARAPEPELRGARLAPGGGAIACWARNGRFARSTARRG
jgi:hypothetical protein